MPGNSFGDIFRITSFGESHGESIGVVIDGCPPGVKIDLEFLQAEMDRRKPGQSPIVTQRKESDRIHLLSGVFEGISTGHPIAILIHNEQQKSQDYDHIREQFRPSHADYTYHVKYGIRDHRGGGRSSARETACRVAAGAIAKLILSEYGIQIRAYVSQVGDIKVEKSWDALDLSLTEQNEVRCPDLEKATQMIQLIRDVRKEGDSVGGIVTCVILHCPPGLGEPVFDRLQADLGKAVLSINACKGFEYGSGFEGAKMRGSKHNDLFFRDDSGIHTRSNHSGGIQGGISNGMPIYFRAAFKPVGTLMRDQESINTRGETVIVQGKGRHDPCVLPRAVPIVEAMAALVVVDHLLKTQSYKNK